MACSQALGLPCVPGAGGPARDAPGTFWGESVPLATAAPEVPFCPACPAPGDGARGLGTPGPSTLTCSPCPPQTAGAQGAGRPPRHPPRPTGGLAPGPAACNRPVGQSCRLSSAGSSVSLRQRLPGAGPLPAVFLWRLESLWSLRLPPRGSQGDSPPRPSHGGASTPGGGGWGERPRVGSFLGRPRRKGLLAWDLGVVSVRRAGGKARPARQTPISLVCAGRWPSCLLVTGPRARPRPPPPAGPTSDPCSPTTRTPQGPEGPQPPSVSGSGKRGAQEGGEWVQCHGFTASKPGSRSPICLGPCLSPNPVSSARQ